MFHFPEFPARSYLFTTHCPSFPQGGFPHSDICGSLPYHNSPQLFAVVHVLLRPLAPRHPPYALCSLTCSALQIGSPVFANKAASHTSSTYSSSSLSYSVLNVPNPLYFSLLTSLPLTSLHLTSLLFPRTSALPTSPIHFSCVRWQTLATPSACHPVGLRGLEPRTPALSAQCSNRLSYRPLLFLPPPAYRDTPFSSSGRFAPTFPAQNRSMLRPSPAPAHTLTPEKW